MTPAAPRWSSTSVKPPVDGPTSPGREQPVVKPAGRRANVERAASGRIDAEDVERVREFDAATARVRMIRRGELDARGRRNRRAGRRHDPAGDRPAAPQNQGRGGPPRA